MARNRCSAVMAAFLSCCLMLCTTSLAKCSGSASAESTTKHRRSLLEDTLRNRANNDLRAQLGVQTSILQAVRRSASMDVTASAGLDGVTLARLAASASAKPSDFEPSGRRLLLKLLQGRAIGATQTDIWSVTSAYDSVHRAATSGASLAQVVAATTHGSKVARMASSRNLDPPAFDETGSAP